jgi:hypothetical protein
MPSLKRIFGGGDAKDDDFHALLNKCNSAPDVLLKLEKLGIEFDRNNLKWEHRRVIISGDELHGHSRCR